MVDVMNKIYIGDCRDTMRDLIADGVKVQTVVTSPPYYGLRDYGVVGQIGLEPSLDEWVSTVVDVFRLVRELLADDGTVWLNLGDSYARDGGPGWQGKSGQRSDRRFTAVRDTVAMREIGRRPPQDLKSKDLMGAPWRVALALQQPYYTGQIKDERDRVWLAAIIDGEGCFFIHKRKAGTSAYAKHTRVDGSEANYLRTADTYGVGLEICNTSKAIIDRVQSIVGTGTVTTQGPEQNARRKQTIHRWRVAPNEAKRIAQEVYPHLVAKQRQARLLFACPSTGADGAAAHQAMMDLHNGVETSVDYPPPPSLFEPGWYLRQDVIWSKPNCMPESVTDRCTKAHEYLFLLAKSERYYYDAEAIKEPASENTHARRAMKMPDGWETGPGAHGRFHSEGRETRKVAPPGQGIRNNTTFEDVALGAVLANRNKRSVWTIPTEAFPGAHFATFPQALVGPCVLAGSRPGDIVFDPFMGSGTVAQVAARLGRKYLGCELNPKDESLQRARVTQHGLELA